MKGQISNSQELSPLIFQALDIYGQNQYEMFFVFTLVHGPFWFKEIGGFHSDRRSWVPTSTYLNLLYMLFCMVMG
jgi:hypothetical protein